MKAASRKRLLDALKAVPLDEGQRRLIRRGMGDLSDDEALAIARGLEDQAARLPARLADLKSRLRTHRDAGKSRVAARTKRTKK
jgi:hypothetical protein